VLFPELAPSGLVGIARLASESELIEQKRRVEYRDLDTRRFIGPCSGEGKPFEWTVNPYRGCEFGCKYCYARYAHEFMELRETEQFERVIFAKTFNLDAFRRELKRIPHGETIAIGTATDPYQPAERRYGITRRILEVFAGERGRQFGLATKSDLVARDVDLWAAVARQNQVYINVTITTADEKLARILEPFAPRPSLRFEAIRALTGAGIPVTVLACPVMPLINDSEESLSAVASAAAEAGAVYMYGNVLFLKSCAQKAFFPMLEKNFPHLVRRYRERYERRPYLNGPYVENIARRMVQIREKHGLNRKPAARASEVWPDSGQLGLFEAI
jgi:DNA repair photolyase